jgi:DmsE family decaheme c-type cytochrome
VVGVICGVLSGFAGSARANDVQGRGDPIAELRNYVQLAAAAQPGATAAENANQAPASVARDESDDDATVALRAFTRRIAANPLPSIKDQPKLADADGLFSAIQQLFNKGNGGQPTSPTAETPMAAPKGTPKGAPKAAPKAAKPAAEATVVGAQVCRGCHVTQAASFDDTLMGRIKLVCETCHGPGSEHVKAGGGRGVGGIISFRSDDLSRTAAENNSICLGCHEKGDRTYWNGSAHESRGLACTNCHTIMKHVSVKYQLKTVFQPDTCFQCHKDRRAQMFRSSHMPVREGKVVCSDCHNPHGTATEALLKEPSINETCYKCHAEKRGPFLFEHAPVRENCLNCHDPHGSINENLLKVSRPRLCSLCHFGAGFGHGQFSGPLAQQTISRSCNNCHTQPHGSNSPAGALFQR